MGRVINKFLLIILISILVCECSKHVIKYSIPEVNVQFNKNYIMAIQSFKDERPEEEHIGKTGGFLKFASKDKHFKKSITQHLKEVFKEEFSKAGLTTLCYNNAEKENYDYTLSGSVFHFQAILKLPKTSAVPYLKQITSIWTKDQFIIAIEIKVQLKDNKTDKLILNKTYAFTEDKKLPTGLFSLARYSRGFNYKLKLLDKALESVVKDIRNDVLMILKKS